MKMNLCKYLPNSCLLFVLVLASCSQSTVVPGRTFYQDDSCRIYEDILSGFQSAVSSLYVKCDSDEPYEVFTTTNALYFDVTVEQQFGLLEISVDYCNVGDDPRNLHAEDVESRFRTRFDRVELGGLRLALDFHEEPRGCFEERIRTLTSPK